MTRDNFYEEINKLPRKQKIIVLEIYNEASLLTLLDAMNYWYRKYGKISNDFVEAINFLCENVEYYKDYWR